MIDTAALEAAYARIAAVIGVVDRAVVLGSGWGDAIAGWTLEASIPYAAIDVMGAATVAGHAGALHVVRRGARRHLVFQGRRHVYEGVPWEPIAFPVYAARRAGAAELLLTNASGGIDPDLQPGDLMIVRDHINLMGAHPLIGPHDPRWGERFPDMTAIYHPPLRRRLHAGAAASGRAAAEGVYLAVTGPGYETPAEIRAMRAMGADAVGMSTVPEAILAHAVGLKVAGLACIANGAAGTAEALLAHDDIVAVTRSAMPRMAALVEHFLAAPAA